MTPGESSVPTPATSSQDRYPSRGAPYGFIGVGAIARAMVEGLSDGRPDAPEICLSPRNAKIAADLAARFPVEIVAEVRDPGGGCPGCGVRSVRVHGRYRRTLLDLPVAGRSVSVRLSVRRFRCENRACEAVTFAEQVPDLTRPYARRTVPASRMLADIGLVLAGRAGARLAQRVGLPAGRGAVLRLVRTLPRPPTPPLDIVGVDDFALRRGHVYGTVLIDLSTHRPVELLPDRERETLAAWLRENAADASIICRDRAGAYAQAATDSLPAAVQVADRWHLWHNLAEHVERAVKRHRSCWKHLSLTVATAPTLPNHVAASANSPHVALPVLPTTPPPSPTAPTESTGLQARNEQRWQSIHDLLDQGRSLRAVMQATGLTRATVRRFARAADPAELDHGRRISRGQALDAYRPFIAQQWADGITNAAVMLQLLHQRGYTGSSSSVRTYLRPFRNHPNDNASAGEPAGAQPVRVPSNRQVTRWLCTRPDDLDPTETRTLADVHRACPHLESLAGHVQSFAVMLTTLAGDRLNDWIRLVQADQHPELHSFVRGLLSDYDAVRAGLTLPHSSGPVEGNINRIKMIKRKTYGRASLDLLRQLVILGP